MVARATAWVCGTSIAGIAGSNPALGMDVCVLWVLSGIYLSLVGITCPEESYGVWCIWVWPWSLDNEEALAH